MGWIYILVASTVEVIGVIGLTLFSQQKNLFNLLLFSSGFALSYLFLYFALNYLDMSIAYAVWMGLGTAGAVLVNMIFFGESRKLSRIFGVILIITGVVGLKMIS
ncbi:MAG: multidrug efflux SMR transporter [Alphaproteobacteria bacterium]|nr:multidrug efflux SMR transporter [Alphaproteobacteria bacterium]